MRIRNSYNYLSIKKKELFNICKEGGVIRLYYTQIHVILFVELLKFGGLKFWLVDSILVLSKLLNQ